MLDPLEPLVYQERLADRDLPEKLESLENRALLEKGVSQDSLERQESPDNVEHLGKGDQRDHLEKLDRRDPRVLLDHAEILARRVSWACLVREVFLAGMV